MMLRTAVLLAAFLVPLAALGQGKLQNVREAVSRPDERENTSDCPSEDSHDTTSSSDSSGWNLLLLPWHIPHAMFDAGSAIRGRFTSHPYAAAATGHMLFDRSSETPREHKWDELPGTQPFSVRSSFEIGSDFRGLDRAGLRLMFDTDSRLGLKTDWDFYRERLPSNRYVHLTLGDITATYRFVQSERLQLHTGFGAKLMFDHDRTYAGFNALYGFDAFPVKPLHLHGSMEGGNLGDAGVLRLRGGAGLLWKHGEIFGGYDWLRIGGTSLHGPYAGLRVWF